MIKATITLTGVTPLLMHSSRLSDPLDPATKALAKVTSKRTKTEDDHLEMAELEFLGSLYLDPDIGPYLPGENIFAALVAGAKLNRLGTTITRGMLVTSDVNPLAYTGPRTAAEMWKSKNFAHRASVKVTTKRVIRTRPIFREWSTEADLLWDPSQLDLAQVQQVADNSGAFIGIGDWRPKFGRFTATVNLVE